MLLVSAVFASPAFPVARCQEASQSAAEMVAAENWNQWRGPFRNGQFNGRKWPATLSEDVVREVWKKDLSPSYSGPVVCGDAIFTTETIDGKNEAIIAFNRETGEQLWRVEWPGALTVPFFAASNGSWIRSTPACDGTYLYVGGMRDVLVCLEARTGKEIWRIDFPQLLQAPLPAFGFVSSPLPDGDSLYVQAGASFVRIRKSDGEIIWRTLQDSGGMMGSAFSSPVIAEIGGLRQLIVQTRTKLAGISLDDGSVLWDQDVPSFRGMNILTPSVYGDAIFTSSYQNQSWLFSCQRSQDAFEVSEAWSNNAQGYMSTPVIIDDHAYLHLQNERITCIDLRNGERKWTSQPVGKYMSMIANGDRILGLNQNGTLMLIRANPEKYELLGEFSSGQEETWAHLALDEGRVLIRGLNSLAVYEWRDENVQP
ncbi:MAG: PQQ-binding-like beta-propeller repeat protein [Planctomycetaceae bacterium]|nr:PQQ-binding-like beta-propeller repeat protein [Planctomycetaceae bacterium]